MRVRSFITLGLFSSAGIVALEYPMGGIVLTCICLIVYLRPEMRTSISRDDRSDVDRATHA